jgi:lipopolysaccharide/colanic/teichoic acid biosynthesis glycosyltransferase
MNNASYERLKRGVDVLASAVALVVLLPLLVVVAACVAGTMGRPILFRQSRAGQHGWPFTLMKFRTMRDVDVRRGRVSDADRLTALGRALRRTSLDELPTLWNVLVGDMSLVGPRPLLPEYLGRYTPHQARRHEVRPGITGLAQVRGRNLLTWERRLALDVWYVDHRSAVVDVRILLRTVATVVSRRGVSADGEATMPEFRGTAGVMAPRVRS